jgi:hypothetical protein
MTRSAYVGGFPRAGLRVLRGAITSHLVIIAVFLVLAVTCWAAFLPTAPSYGRSAGYVLGFFATGTFIALVSDIWQRFGVRVVPQFEPRLQERPGTYFGGRSLVWRMKTLDRLARDRGATALSDFGIAGDNAAQAPTWFDPDAGRHTVRVLIDASAGFRWQQAVSRDLLPIDAALARAQAERAQFRLVVVADTGMNGMFWEHLRETGF